MIEEIIVIVIKYANAVFEGGGVKGIGLVGAVMAAEQHGIKFVNMAGTSAGAMVASLLSVGYSGQDIKNMLMRMDYREFEDRKALSMIPYVGPIFSIIKSKGVFEGNALELWLKEMYRRKGSEKFGDIKIQTRDEGLKYRLRVIASDISNKRMLILPQDIKKYGIDPDYLDIAKAVRMSMGLPFFYKPVILKYGIKGYERKCVIVDGGLLSNFPVWIFDSRSEKRPTIGFKLAEPVHNIAGDSMDIVHYILNIVSTMSEAFDQRYIEESNFKRTIMIPTVGVGTTDFDISREKSMELFQSGFNAAMKFFSNY